MERRSTRSRSKSRTRPPSSVPLAVQTPIREKLKADRPKLWTDAELLRAGKEYSALIEAQRQAFGGKKPKPDYPEKALNVAVLSAWAYVAGVLRSNAARLKRHFDLKDSVGKDPLNAVALCSRQTQSDAQNYRGLGYRTDPRERGRFVELFYLQAEDERGRE